MKVVHLNTNLDISSAPYKLHKALTEGGYDSALLTLNESGLDGAYHYNHSFFFKLFRRLGSIKRKRLLKKYNRKPNMIFSAAPFGVNIQNMPVIRESRIICIHWVSADFLSPGAIKGLLDTGKRIIVFCHDNNHFTGGCHVRMGCEGYKTLCGACEMLGSDDKNDISHSLCLRKKEIYKNRNNLCVISPSKWMDGNVAASQVFMDIPHYVCPNAVDTAVFKHYDCAKAREILGLTTDKRIILVAIKKNQDIPYNGMEYLKAVYNRINSEYENRQNVCWVFFGTDTLSEDYKENSVNMGFIKKQEQLSLLYAAADVYLTTSLEDSFNQSVAECLSCGTPVVAFDNGGIADIVNAGNGYLARLRDCEDLYNGLTAGVSGKLPVMSAPDISRDIEERFGYKAVCRRFTDILTDMGFNK